MRSVLEPLTAKLEERKGGTKPGQPPRPGARERAARRRVGVLSATCRSACSASTSSSCSTRAPERLLLVAPEPPRARRAPQVDEADLVAWVAIHEVTHAVQFTSVPWLREHLAGELRQLLETVDVTVDPSLTAPVADDLRGSSTACATAAS
jgi:hypothetical protein